MYVHVCVCVCMLLKLKKKKEAKLTRMCNNVERERATAMHLDKVAKVVVRLIKEKSHNPLMGVTMSLKRDVGTAKNRKKCFFSLDFARIPASLCP